MQPGDKIFSPNADLFYIKGQVKAPGGYGLLPHMTLVMALARGGGLTDTGSDSHIKIIRKNVEITPKDLNSEVLPDDVIDVGEGLVLAAAVGGVNNELGAILADLMGPQVSGFGNNALLPGGRYCRALDCATPLESGSRCLSKSAEARSGDR